MFKTICVCSRVRVCVLTISLFLS